MPETDALASRLMTFNECQLMHASLTRDVANNKAINDKLTKIIIGNGDVGLVEEVHGLKQRNELMNQIFGVFKSILTTVITLYLAGVLKL